MTTIRSARCRISSRRVHRDDREANSTQKEKLGGRGRARTGDPLLAKQVLSQLSYTPTAGTLFDSKVFAAVRKLRNIRLCLYCARRDLISIECRFDFLRFPPGFTGTSPTGVSFRWQFFSMPPKDILSLLEGGDRRTIGRSDEVAAMVSKKPGLFPALIAGLWSEDPLVRMRAADAAEKVTRQNREFLKPHKKELLGLMAEAKEQELRWHLAVMVPRLLLTSKERQLAATLLDSYLEDRSSIVRTFALQGLADLAQEDPSIRPAVIEVLRESIRKGTPAMKARSRKLLAHLQRTGT
jgi:hypothetical protein